MRTILLALLVVALMGTWALVTPDGWTFEFDPSKFSVDPGIPDGVGLPPVQHQTQTIFHQPGQFLQDISILPRVVTITAKINGTCLDELHALRCKLWNALRWNRTVDDPPLPAQLVYRGDCAEATLDCFYIGDTTEDVGIDEKQQGAGIRLIAYDPFWNGTTPTEEAVPATTTLSVHYIVGRFGGLWDALGDNGTSSPVVAAYDPVRNLLYIGGYFTNWAGIGNADAVAKYDFNTSTWSALSTGISGAAGQVYALQVMPDGTLMVGGYFATAGGVAVGGLARYNPDTDSFTAPGTGADVATAHFVRGFAIDANRSVLYIKGLFHSLNGVAAEKVASYNYSTGVTSAMGAGLWDEAGAMAVAPNGRLYISGFFKTADSGVTVNGLGYWDPTTATYTAIPGTFNTYSSADQILIAPNGDIYVTGMGSIAGMTVNEIAKWNGASWSALGSGINGQVFHLDMDSAGLLYVGGVFTSAGGLTLADHLAVWNGTIWGQLDINLPGNPDTCPYVLNDELVVLFTTAGNATIPAQSFVATTLGDYETFPVITVTGPAVLEWIANEQTGKILRFNMTLTYGEIATIDLRPLHKSITSNFRGDLLRYAALLPLSDFATFSIVPHPIAPNGVNVITFFETAATPVEVNDDANQLSGWTGITGIAYTNVAADGALYVSIVADGGGFYHVNLYDDAARTHLVGHTATYNSNGAKAIVADNASGLGGTVTVDAHTGADADIVVYFSVGSIEWTDRFLSLDCAAMCSEYLPLIGVSP